MGDENEVLTCQGLSFSAEWARMRQQRMAAAVGVNVMRRIVAVGLYLLGAKRSKVAQTVGFPVESLRTFLRRLLSDGLPALQDRRRSPELPAPPSAERARVQMVAVEGEVRVGLGPVGELRVRQGNRLQLRTVLLTLWNAGLVSTREVADQLDITSTHVRNLGRRLGEDDAGMLLDRRRGQTRDYRVTAEVKSELIQQAAAHALTEHSTSSSALTSAVNDRRGWNLAARTVRMHMRKLGLAEIAESLPALVTTLKKTPRHAGSGRRESVRNDARATATADHDPPRS